MTPEAALEYYRRKEEAKATTEEECAEILAYMAQEGLITSVIKTGRTKEKYIEDLGKHSKVLDLSRDGIANKKKENNNED
jgi:hypothetical protein